MEKVFFTITDIDNDIITDIDSNQLTTPLVAKDYIYNDSDPNYWIEYDDRGFAVLCTNLPLFTDQVLTMRTTNSTTYVTSAKSFIKTHPVHAPK